MEDLKEKYNAKLIDVFNAFITICENNNLSYYCLGGTLIGAIRHKGMIPWDDDIDVAMPRVDYDKLMSLKFESNFLYEIVSMDNHLHYYLPYAKFCDKNSTLLEHSDIPCVLGLFIDIFPLDGANNNLIIRKSNLLDFKRTANKLAITSKIWKENYKSVIRSLFKFQLRTAWNEFILSFNKDSKRKKVIGQLNQLMTKYEFNHSTIIGNYGGMWGIKEFWDKSWFEDYKIVDFDRLQVRIPIGFHQLLTHVYGDYMQLPPIEKRVTHHHLAFLDLYNRRSIEYIMDHLKK